MQPNFWLFGTAHLTIIGCILSLPAICATIVRRIPLWGRPIRFTVAAALLMNAVLWYGYEASHGSLKFPDGLPLELCDATLVVTVIASFTLSPTAFDLAYYGALAGTSMAVLTPDLWEHFPSFGTVQFFIAHGLVIVEVLFLAWSKEARPRPGSVWRAMFGLNIFAAFVGAFDYVFRTNYMYLRSKPPNASLLDYLGPWPWYLAVTEIVAFVLFSLLYLPYARAVVKPIR